MTVSKFLSNSKKTTSKSEEIAEAKIEETFCRYARRKVCQPLKLIFHSKAGFPDRTILAPNGRVCFIEFKRKGKKLSKAQMIVRRALEFQGFPYFVADEIGQAEAFLDDFLKKAK